MQTVYLTWTGASSPNVDVYRDGSMISNNTNHGAYTYNIDQREGGSYTNQACETGTSTCSNEAAVVF